MTYHKSGSRQPRQLLHLPGSRPPRRRPFQPARQRLDLGQTLEAADNGIKAITDVVESLKATARSALQSPSAYSQKASVSSVAVEGLTADNLTVKRPGTGRSPHDRASPPSA